jgi:hypothetical protein
MKRKPPAAGRAAFVCAALTCLACDSDFAPYNRLESLRVLAIQSEPAAPAAGETAVLTPLLYAPGGAQIDLEWSWCPLVGPSDDGFPCLLEEADFRAALGQSAANIPAFALGNEITTSFPFAFDPQVLAALCSGALAEVSLPALPDCSGGFQANIRLVARTDQDEVVSVRSLPLRFAGEHPANQNPTIDALSALTAEGSSLIEGAPAVTLPRGAETVIEVTPSADAAESYAGEDEARVVSERLVFTWFVEAGETEYARTSFIDGAVSLDEARRNRWEPASARDFPADRARLIVVVRDNRGGVGWRQGSVLLAGAP